MTKTAKTTSTNNQEQMKRFAKCQEEAAARRQHLKTVCRTLVEEIERGAAGVREMIVNIDYLNDLQLSQLPGKIVSKNSSEAAYAALPLAKATHIAAELFEYLGQIKALEESQE